MQILSYVIPDYPTLLDPIRLVILTGLVFFWLYCVQHADRHMRTHGPPARGSILRYC